MPELPEVEVVRRGLASHVLGRQVLDVGISHPRTVRRQPGGADEFVALLRGRQFLSAQRRGKFLWLATDAPGLALAAHLGMSGQFRVGGEHKHARVRIELGGRVDSTLWFVDQRTFGWVAMQDLVPSAVPGADPELLVPEAVRDIAVDLFDPLFDDAAIAGRMHARPVAVKRQLLDQSLLSGIGNIYADESLWRARINPATPGNRVSVARLGQLMAAAREVLEESLAAGGTSFDSLYVNVNGTSGYFSRGLAVYGRADQPCPRCATPIRRVAFANRSSHFCPSCQRRR